MKNIIILSVLLSLFFFAPGAGAQCSDDLMSEVAASLEGYNYLKDYKVMMKKAKKNQLPPKASYSIILNKGTKYRFLINDSDELLGQLKFELYTPQDGLVLTNYDGINNKYYGGVEYQCNATTMYTVNISFSNGEEGCGVVIVGFKEKKTNSYDTIYGK